MYEVDARGLSCPEPVMLTAAALKKHKGESVKVLVSEPHTRMNVEKYAKSQGIYHYHDHVFYHDIYLLQITASVGEEDGWCR